MRLCLTTYYDYRISSLQAHVNTLQKQRDTTIGRLKAATKYDSTQQLLEKYGGGPAKSKAGTSSNRKPSNTEDKPKRPKGERTSFIPPPTANIPGRNAPVSMPNTPQRSTPVSPGPMPPFTAAAVSAPWQKLTATSPTHENEDFAPNAFSPNDFATPQYAQPGQEHKWHDRFLDVLLGEDESHPKNRLALICKGCRLVNGQAPPGVKQLEDVGKWRCSSCGTMNGIDNETERIVAEINGVSGSRTRLSEQKSETSLVPPLETIDKDHVPAARDEDPESDVTQYSDDETDKKPDEKAQRDIVGSDAETTHTMKTRSKAKKGTEA